MSVNGQQDAISDNNNSSFFTDLDSGFDKITLIINADQYPSETSWQLYDVGNNELVGSGNLNAGDQIVSEDICIDYSSCFSLIVFDSYGDGICCGFGEGNFFLLNASGDTLVNNDGIFEHDVEETFCPNGEGCTFTADVSISNATDENTADGTITINPTSGLEPYEYSIDGGENFSSDNTFANLAPGNYMIVVRDASETCFYEETVEVQSGIVNNVNEISSNEIKVFPNPTEENLIIEIGENFNIPGSIKIEIYDALGRLIRTDSISRFNEDSKVIISLKEYASGSYIAKCYNQSFEKYFKVIKL